MFISIDPERPDSAEATLLITELEAHLTPLYPQESRHGFSIERLLREGVAFFVVRVDGEAAGCGGVKFFQLEDGPHYAEVKRMYVRPHWRGYGLAKALLNHLAEYTRQRQIELLRLETGIYQTEAIGLYERWGFQRIPPFGDYRADPLSIYFEKRIR
jgi:ribosomal protein S18 acetylase RimI-like enzyme